MEATPCVKAVIMAASQYRNNKTDCNMVYLQRQLEVLIGITSKRSALKFFVPRNLLPTECLTAVIDILQDQNTKQALALKCIMLLQNLVVDNEIRISLHESFNLTPALAGIIKSQDGSSVDSLTVECVDLLQKVTYGHKISFEENYVEDLLLFIIKQIIASVHEVNQPCLGLLANLCRDNFSVQSYIKNLYISHMICKVDILLDHLLISSVLLKFMCYYNIIQFIWNFVEENCKALYKSILTNLTEERNDLSILVFSLSIISSLCLNEGLGEKLFQKKNINQTFSMIFNILMRGDSGVTRRYAVDLMTDILKHEKIKSSLSVFDKLSPCIEGILLLISSSTAESVVKLFELLLAFCTVEGVRGIICKCILSSTMLDDRGRFTELLALPVSQIKDALVATVHWASQSVETHDNAPLYAFDFLSEFYEELIYSGLRVRFSVHAQMLMSIIMETLKTSLDASSASMNKMCSKIVKAIQLLTVLCGEEDIRKKICEAIDLNLLSSLLDYQYNSNQVALTSLQSSLHSQDWSERGVDIVIYLLDLMTKLHKKLPSIDALLSATMQDSRIVPFLSYGLTSNDRSRVQVTLSLVTVGSVLDGFPVVLLGDAIVACNSAKSGPDQIYHYPRKRNTPHHVNSVHREQNGTYLFENKENIPVLNSGQRDRVSSDSGYTDASIQSIIDKWHTGMEIKDTKTSEIIELYEHKLQSLQTKEGQLEDLLEAKVLSLEQADRLIAQYRSRRAQYEAEAHKMRSLLMESERTSEQYREQLNELTLQREKLHNDHEITLQENIRLQQIAEEHQQLTTAYTELAERFESTEKSLLSLKQEHKTLVEMHEMLQRHNESLKHQHDIASEQLSKLEDERKQLSKQLKEKETKLHDLTKNHQKLKGEHEKTEKERDELEEAIDKLRVDLSQAEKIKKQLKHQVASLELVCQKHEADLKDKETKLEALHTEVDKHAQIAALIHSLSSGKSDGSKK